MTESVKIVEPNDIGRLQEIGELSALAYLADGLIDTAHPYLPQLRDAAARARDALLLALVDGERGAGRVAGTITLVPPGSRLAELGQEGAFELRMLAVSPLERGRGVGRMLTTAALDLAVTHGARKVVLSTMESMSAAHRLYERVGFSRAPELDATIDDHPDGTTAKAVVDVPPAPGAIRVHLLGYSWEPRA